MGGRWLRLNRTRPRKEQATLPNITLPGGANQTITLPVSSQESASIIRTAYSAIVASVNAGKSVMPIGTAPPDVTLQAGSPITTVLDTATGPLTVNDASGAPETVISGSGGLAYNALGGPVGNVLVVASGTNNTVNLGQGTATVVADGVSTVNAIYGGDTVYATAGGQAVVNAGHGATVYLAGQDTVNYYGTGAKVYAQDGVDIAVVGFNLGVNGGDADPINQVARGNVTISAFGDASGVYTGYAGQIVVDSTAHGPNSPAYNGGIIIDPEASDILVIAGAGSETLFGTGDAGGRASNRGSDVVNSGNGFFHGGSGGNVLETSATPGVATLVGGATGPNTDQLYSQASWDTMFAGRNTTVMDASGGSGGTARLQGFAPASTNIGNLIEARDATSVSIFGAAGGANTIVSGTGASTVMGYHGSAGGNVYIDGGGAGNSGAITISDFVVGVDKFLLNGATVQTIPPPGSSTVALSDGTRVTFANLVITSANQGNVFS